MKQVFSPLGHRSSNHHMASRLYSLRDHILMQACAPTDTTMKSSGERDGHACGTLDSPQARRWSTAMSPIVVWTKSLWRTQATFSVVV